MKKALVDAGYPPNWQEITDRVRFNRANSQCECRGQCGHHHGKNPGSQARCKARHDQAHPVSGSLVLLQTAHLDHTPSNVDDDNLLAMCQRCHLAYDGHEKAQRLKRSRHKAKAWRDWWE